MDLQLTNKVAIITGSSKGIGYGIAAAFLKEGAKVALVGRDAQSLERARVKLANEEQVLAVQADVTKDDDCKRLISHVISHFGTVDILVNNAGGSSGTSVENTELDEFYEAFELNYYSAVRLSKLVLPHLTEKGEGSIINISSIYGRESGGKPTYNNSKAAMISFTKALADEVAQRGVRVNGVAPGAILHPTGNWQKRIEESPEKMDKFVHSEIPAGRFGTVEEVANVVTFLASDKASWVIGATINVDGGQSRANF